MVPRITKVSRINRSQSFLFLAFAFVISNSYCQVGKVVWKVSPPLLIIFKLYIGWDVGTPVAISW